MLYNDPLFTAILAADDKSGYKDADKTAGPSVERSRQRAANHRHVGGTRARDGQGGGQVSSKSEGGHPSGTL